MKQYIKAAYDPSKPEWLDFKSPAASKVVRALEEKYALAQAKFYDEPQPGSIPIYLLYEVYESRYWDVSDKRRMEEIVYIPDYGEYYNDIWIDVGERFRHLTNAAKAKFNHHVVDITYMVAPEKSTVTESRDYVDPRYYSDDDKWKYGGQVRSMKRVRDPNTGDYTNQETWNNAYLPYGSAARDKSGYVLLSPSQLYANLLAKFPNRLQHLADSTKATMENYYERIKKAKYKIFQAYDIREGKIADDYGYNSVFYELNQAVHNYSNTYKAIQNALTGGENGTMNEKDFTRLATGTDYDSVPRMSKRIDDNLRHIYTRLGIEEK
jgi:hypothetical protein